ncbi:MAG: Fic family protein [Alphaproteobacteria bacterium]|nr:Fic family protein [Alphaproteobacteria bacterium]
MKSYRDYFYPDTETLRNRLGIHDAVALAIAEAELSRARMRQPLQGVTLTAEGLKAIHRHLFQDVYDWAGAFRTVDMVKLRERGQSPVTFAPGARVARVEIPRFFGELASDLAAGAFGNIDPPTFAYRAAVYMADLNIIHPFPEGNGRTQRLFLEQLATRAGYRLDHTRLTAQAWLAAAIDSYGQDFRVRRTLGEHRLMTTLIAQAVAR